MMYETKFLIENRRIIGLIIGDRHRRWKSCKWCGNTFIPYHNKQAYCDRVCKDLRRRKYKSDWMYTRRIKEQNGEIINDRSILNVGTGGLGSHCKSDYRVEHRKIVRELRELGLR